MPGCNCLSFEGDAMLPTPPPVRQPIARVTLGEIIAREAEQLPDLEQPSARDVGLMLKRIEDAIGQHLVELVRGTNARAEQLQHDVRHPGLVAPAALGHLVGSLAYLAQRWDGLDDLPETIEMPPQGPQPGPDETPTERPEG
jgi:hypothetical protein